MKWYIANAATPENLPETSSLKQIACFFKIPACVYMHIYNLISITLITAPSLRSPLPLLSLQFFLVRLTLHVHGVGLWAVEFLTAHIASVACGWGRLTGRVFSIGRFVWLVFNCKRQMTSYEDYDYSILLKF